MKILMGLLDFLPGFKSNTGAIVLILTTVLQLVGADAPLVEVIRKIAEALLGYGIVMKSLRK